MAGPCMSSREILRLFFQRMAIVVVICNVVSKNASCRIVQSWVTSQAKFMNQQIRCKEFLFFIATADMGMYITLKSNTFPSSQGIVLNAQFFIFNR